MYIFIYKYEKFCLPLQKTFNMNSKYVSDEKTKQEFCKFLKWTRENNVPDNLDEAVNKYLEDSDIAVFNMRVLHGANTRNAKKELIMGLSAALVGIVAGLTIAYYATQYLLS